MAEQQTLAIKSIEHLSKNLAALKHADVVPVDLLFKIQGLANDLDKYVAQALLEGESQ